MSTDLHFAAQAGDVSEVERLVAAGADVNIQDENGNTPLKYASAEPHPEVLSTLISLGANPHLADRRGFTPIHCVAGHGFYEESIEMAEILIKAGADVNVRSKVQGFVPLHEARTVRMIDFLLQHGADPTIKNDEGQTPEQYLREDDEIEEAEHLTKRTANGYQDVAPNACPASSSSRHDRSNINPQSKLRPRSGVRGLDVRP